jgi:hypothetical protein
MSSCIDRKEAKLLEIEMAGSPIPAAIKEMSFLCYLHNNIPFQGNIFFSESFFS